MKRNNIVSPIFEFERLFFVHSIHFSGRDIFVGGVELDRHAQTAEHHVSIAVLCPKCLVSHFKTWGAVNSAIDPCNLQISGR